MTKPPDPDDTGLSEAAKKELADAIRIVKEDRMYAALHNRFTPKTDDPPADDDGGKGKPPKPKPNPKPEDDPKDPPPTKDPADPPKKSGLWWGEAGEDE